MSKDTIYWIFSTLPQVLAALTGLVMAGLTIYDQNLKNQVKRDPSLEDFLIPLLQNVSKSTFSFCILSIITIITDVVVLGVAENIAETLHRLSELPLYQSILWVAFLVILALLNSGTLVILIPIIKPILNPNEWEKVRDKEQERIMHNRNKDENPTANAINVDQNPESKDEAGRKGNNKEGYRDNATHENNQTNEPTIHREVSQLRFIRAFRQFDSSVRELFPDSEDVGISSLAKRLFDDNLLPAKYRQELKDIIGLYNISKHGGEIGIVDDNLITTLKDITKLLRDRILQAEETLIGPKARAWNEWVRENVDDLDEAYNLDQAVRSNSSYGEYSVIITGYHLIIEPPNGRKLVLAHKDIPKFLLFLERRFTSDPGFTIEDEKSFRDALNKIRDED